MAYFVLVQLLIAFAAHAVVKADKLHTEGYLGERKLDSYAERYYPLVQLDLYRGRMSFQDESFFKNYFDRYIMPDESALSEFMKTELASGLLCSNELFSKHYDAMRYSYRLITISYLLEGQWHLDNVSKHLGFRKGCGFDLNKWLGSCRPKSDEMKKFVDRLKKFSPKYKESLPSQYNRASWTKDFDKKDFNYYSHYRLNQSCKGKCFDSELEGHFNRACAADENLMTLICSEEDEAYGLSQNRDAFQLVSGSNVINTYNQQGEAQGCLRRFAEVMSHKEARYPVLNVVFPPIKSHLRNAYQERFIQGRVFFYGSGKEFEEKGVSNLYFMDQPLKLEALPESDKEPAPPVQVAVAPVSPTIPKSKTPEPAKSVVQKPEKIEMKKAAKSAFLLAAEARKIENLDIAEVDMLKLKFDHVFTLNQLNNLSSQLKSFMTREALEEMQAYDKLGAKEGPVPLLFIKFMVDMQEHAGLYNLVSVLGERFWVSNEIDKDFKPEAELIKLVNDANTGNQWQIYVIKAD